MADIGDITVALANVFSDVVGLRATDYVPDSVSPPAAFVNLTDIVEDTMGYETLSVHLDAVIVVARGAAPRVGQRSLFSFYGDVIAAVAANSDLGLEDGTEARVIRYRSLSIEEIAALSLYGGAYEIVVTTPG